MTSASDAIMLSPTGLVWAVLLLLAVCWTSASSTPASAVPPTQHPGTSLRQIRTGFASDLAELRRENEDLRQDNTGLRRDNTNLRRDNTNLRQDNANLRNDLEELRRTRDTVVGGNLTGDTSTPAPPATSSSGGATYVRWGRTSCPPETDLVYKGYAGGSHYSDPGAAADSLCLPEDPQYNTSAPVTYQARVFGAEYETNNEIFNNHDHDVPCAVCRSPTRSSAIMVPARTSCHPGFHREYFGYLMAGYFGHKAASEFVCVDTSPENVAGGASSNNGALFYFAVSRCGSLRCPPYQEGRAVTCVVCSK